MERKKDISVISVLFCDATVHLDVAPVQEKI